MRVKSKAYRHLKAFFLMVDVVVISGCIHTRQPELQITLSSDNRTLSSLRDPIELNITFHNLSKKPIAIISNRINWNDNLKYVIRSVDSNLSTAGLNWSDIDYAIYDSFHFDSPKLKILSSGEKYVYSDKGTCTMQKLLPLSHGSMCGSDAKGYAIRAYFSGWFRGYDLPNEQKDVLWGKLIYSNEVEFKIIESSNTVGVTSSRAVKSP